MKEMTDRSFIEHDTCQLDLSDGASRTSLLCYGTLQRQWELRIRNQPHRKDSVRFSAAVAFQPADMQEEEVNTRENRSFVIAVINHAAMSLAGGALQLVNLERGDHFVISVFGNNIAIEYRNSYHKTLLGQTFCLDRGTMAGVELW